MDRSLITTSKFLSLVLRHQPETIGLRLDANGWVNVDVLLEAANRSGRKLTRELLCRVVETNDKQRFAFNEDKSRIRASQGHSVRVDLQLEAKTPPTLLYHGTVARFLDSIRRHGLQPQARRHVHLSPDLATATVVGGRRGTAVILTVRAHEMHSEGRALYLSANGVWLTDHVPVRFIDFPNNTNQ